MQQQNDNLRLPDNKTLILKLIYRFNIHIKEKHLFRV